MRRRIATYRRPPDLSVGEFEADESYFGARRVKGKRGRGANGKTIVFGLYKRDGKVYTEIVPDVKSKTLQRIIRGQASIDSVIHTDGWVAYDGLVDLGYENIFAFNTAKTSFRKATDSTSTASKVFGALPSIGWRNLKELTVRRFNFICLKLNLGSTIVILICTSFFLMILEILLFQCHDPFIL